MNRFAIVLDRPTAVYAAGEVVSGRVEFWIEQSKSLLGISLTASGGSRVNLAADSTSFRISEETYFDQKLDLTGGGRQAEILMMPGRYEYSFSVRLPEQLPPTFSGEFGSVAYLLEAVADQNWHSDDRVAQPLTVFSVNPEEADLQSLRPSESTKTSRALWCVGAVQVSVRIDRSRIAPGQKLPVHADIWNSGGDRVRRAKLELVRRSTYTAGHESKTRELVLHREVCDGADLRVDHLTIVMPIPVTVPSGLPLCQNIDVSYHIQFKVDPCGWNPKITVRLDINIGSAPSLESLQEPDAAPPPPQRILWAPSAPAVPTAPGASSEKSREQLGTGVPSTSEAPPPSYDDVVKPHQNTINAKK